MFFDCFGELRSIEVFNEKYIGSNVFNVVVFLGFGFFYYGFLIVNVYWNVEFLGGFGKGFVNFFCEL